jgi:type II secretory pathway pseudopilin PulG
MLMSRVLAQTGDTIVEVLVAMAVLSLVLGGAYVTARHSLIATRQAQERSEALALVQGQIETLRGLAAEATLPPTNLFNESHDFCLDGVGDIEEGVVDATGNPIPNGELPAGDIDANYTSSCALNQSGQGVSYDIAIERCDTSATGSNGNCSTLGPDQPAKASLFIVSAHWDSLASGRDQLSVEYQLYPGGI